MKKYGLGLAGATALILFAGFTLLSGCGGGGGGATPQAASTPGYGPLRVSMKITRADAARAAGESSGNIVINVAVTGYYKEDNSAFPPVTTQVTISSSGGTASVQNLLVPIGVNHLVTAIATYPDGASATVKVIVPEIKENVEATTTADSETTAVANAAIQYARANGLTLSKVLQSKIDEYEETVAAFIAAGYDPSEIDIDNIVDYADSGSVATSVTISPATATVSLDATQEFSPTVKNEFNIEITATVAWTVTGNIGTVSEAGVFTPSAEGTGAVTATIGSVSGSAEVTVVLIACSTDSECADTDPLTTDTCTNPGTSQSSCSNTCDIACSADTDCDDSDSGTTDTCTNPGTCSAACENTCIPACSADTDCDDSIVITADTCISPDTCSAYCDNPVDTSLVPQFSAFLEHPSDQSSMLNIVLDDSGSKLFAYNSNAVGVDVFDLAAASHTSTISLNDPISYLVKDPGRNYGYLLGNNYEWQGLVARQAPRSAAVIQDPTYQWSVQKLDLQNETVSDTIVHSSYFTSPSEIEPAISAARDELYFGQNYSTGGQTFLDVHTIDLSSFTEATTIVSESNQYYWQGTLAVNDDAGELYVNNDYLVDSCDDGCSDPHSDLMGIDLATGAETGSVTMGTAPGTWLMRFNIGYISGSPYAYTVGYGYETSSYTYGTYDLSTGAETCTAVDSPTRQHLGVFEPFNHVYVTGATGVLVLDGTDCSLVATLELPSSWIYGFAVDEAAGKVYISHAAYVISVIQYAPDGTITPPDTSGIVIGQKG